LVRRFACEPTRRLLMRLSRPQKGGLDFPNWAMKGTPSMDLKDWMDALLEPV
jgi:hypothetical protein